MLVAEVTEVSGAGYCNHLSNAGGRPTGDDVPHALAACQWETILFTWHRSCWDRHASSTVTEINHMHHMIKKYVVCNAGHTNSNTRPIINRSNLDVFFECLPEVKLTPGRILRAHLVKM